MHATIWKRIRDRNPELYRLPNLIRTWRDSRPGWFSTLRGSALLLLAAVLPESWCNSLFFRLRDEFNKTLVIVTHDMQLAEMADRMVRMKDGQVVAREEAKGKV